MKDTAVASVLNFSFIGSVSIKLPALKKQVSVQYIISVQFHFFVEFVAIVNKVN